jgi:uncharacterized protein YjbI with pentapeptide repeats
MIVAIIDDVSKANRDAWLGRSVIDDQNISISMFTNAKLSGTRLSNVDLSGITFENDLPTHMATNGARVFDLSACI